MWRFPTNRLAGLFITKFCQIKDSRTHRRALPHFKYIQKLDTLYQLVYGTKAAANTRKMRNLAIRSAGKSAQDLESIANASWPSHPIFGADVGGSLAAGRIVRCRVFAIILVCFGSLNSAKP